jgi:twinkle protein
MTYFGVKTELSTTDGFTPVAHYYPLTKRGEVVGYKKRAMPKTFTTIGDAKGGELFGQNKASKLSNKKLYITEGELDAVALYQALVDYQKGTQWESSVPSVVSITHGSKAALKDISFNIDFVRSHPEVVLCFDQDEQGKEAVAEVAKLIPGVLVVSLPEKDANDMVLKGKTKELAKAALFGAKKHKPPAVVSVEDVWDRATKPVQMGLSFPWPTVTKLTYGIRKKCIYGLGAGVGIGKTEVFHEIQSHLLSKHRRKIGVMMFEEDAGRTLKALAEKIFNKPFTVPDGDFTQKELEDSIESLKDKILLYDTKVGKDWDEVKAAIRYMVAGEGIGEVFLDHLTALTAHLSASEANDHLNHIMSELSELVNELDCTIFYCSHLNPPNGGDSHERGGKVLESQFTSSRAAIKWSHYLFGLERNKDPNISEEERNMSTLTLLKDRENGNVGTVKLFYNKYTRCMLEPEGVR